MPYEYLNVDCEIIICRNNSGDGSCDCDCESHEVEADSTDCRHFDISLKEFSKDFSNEACLQEVVEMLQSYDVPYSSIDDTSMHLQSVSLMAPNGSCRKNDYGVVRCSEKDIEDFRFWRSIDGVVGYTHKMQLELAF